MRILKVRFLFSIALILSALLCLQSPAQAQFSGYSFSQNTLGTYNAISGGIVAGSGASLDNERYFITLPFPFTIAGISYTQAYLCANGYIAFGTVDPGGSQYSGIASSVKGFSVAAGFSADLAGLNSTTELRYETQGTAPNRTFVVQWKNFGYPGSTVLTANFQVRLSEGTNTTQIVYGNCSLGGSSSILSVQVGLRDTTNAGFFHRSATSTWSSVWTSTSMATAATDNILYTTNNNPPNGLTYTFSAPPVCTAPSSQASNLVLTANSRNSVSGSFSAALANGYLVVRTPGTAVWNQMPVNGTSYSTGTVVGNGTVVAFGSSTTFTDNSLSRSSQYTYTVYSYNGSGCMGGLKYNIVLPPSGSVTTLGPKSYVWAGGTAPGNWMTPSNWLPMRTVVDVEDTLVFNSGNALIVTNMPTQVIDGLHITNGTSVLLQSNSIGDSLLLQRFLTIAAGSTLSLTGAPRIKVRFTGTAVRSATISGTLNLQGSSVYDAKGAVTTVYGTVNVSGSGAHFNTTCATCTNEIVFAAGSFYNHQRDGGAIPKAQYAPTSTVNITGTVANSPTDSNIYGGSLTVGNLNFNTPGLNASIDQGYVYKVGGNLNIMSTGTSTGKIAMKYMDVRGNFYEKGNVEIQEGTYWGDMTLDTGTVRLLSAFTSAIIIKGNFTQTSASTIWNNAAWEFRGTNLQNIDIKGVFSFNLSSKYRLYNPIGAKLTGILPVSSSGQVGVYGGGWTGTGSFNYTASNAGLLYATPTSVTTSPVEWPSMNGPSSVAINLTGQSPYNRVFLSGPRTINTLNLSKGVLVLGDYDLTMNAASLYTGSQTPDAGIMIATNGLGRFIYPVRRALDPFVFPIGDITGVDEVSPITMYYSGNASSPSVGVRVVNAKHPADTATTNYLNRYWEIYDGATVAGNYWAHFSYVAADVVGTVPLKAAVWNGAQWANYPASVANNQINTLMSLSTANYPLSGVAITARMPDVIAGTTYTWTGAVSQDYTIAGNWTPARNVPSPGDFLLFNNGQINGVNNIPTQVVSRITVTGNTSVNASFQTGTQVFTLWADTSATTEELVVDSGSSFAVTTNSASQINFWPRGSIMAKAQIAGRLEIGGWLSSLATNPILDLTHCSAVVTPSGVLSTNGTFQISPFISSADSLIVYGTYEVKLTGNITVVPIATWKDGSLVFLNGNASNYTSSYMGLNQNFYNLTYDNPNQSQNGIWANLPDSVRNVFRMVSTGTKKLSFYVYNGKGKTVWNKYIQTDGNIEIPKGAGGAVMVLDTFYKTGGTFNVTGTSNIGFPTLWFCGNNGRQLVNFDVSPTGSLNYRISNPAGIQLTGTGGFTGLSISNNCGLYLSTTATTPIATTLPIQYLGTASTLTFDTTGYVGSGNLNADSIVFPAIAGPPILTINTGTHNVIMPISRILTGKLKMISGNIDLGSNDLTLGTSATSTGTIEYTDGLINVTTGSFTRWFNPANLPYRNFSSALGNFPMGYRGINRWVSLYFSGSNALTLGGTITVRHDGASGLTTGLSIPDGTFTINNRSNASWAFEGGNGLTFSATGMVGVLLTAGAHNLYNNSGNLHVMQPNAVVGTHVTTTVNGANYVAERQNMTLAQLTDTTFHIGSAGSIGSVYISVASGNWNTGSTWNLGTVPGIGDAVIISAGDTVTVNTPDSAKNLLVNSTGTLRVAAGSLLIDTQVTNNGFVEVRGGNMTLGPTGGGAKLFESRGTLSVSSGTLEVNGSLYISEYEDTTQKGAAFIQSGGTIRIDGNSLANGAVAAGDYHFYINSDNIGATGGTLMIVDPHADANSAVFGTLVGSFGPNHTISFGDGISTQAGNTNGFYIRASSFKFGNVVVKGSPSGLNRDVRTTIVNVGGNLELHNLNASFVCSDLNLGGNLLVDTQTRFVNTRRLYFGDGNYYTSNPSLNSPVPVPASQLVTGTGVFANSETNPTGNFASIVVNNSSNGGVTLSIGDVSYSSSLIFMKGNIYMAGNNVLIATASTNPPTASDIKGWVVGKYRVMSTVNTIGGLFPIGDSTTYSPLSIGSIPVLSSGSITANVVRGDHPAIGGSGLDAAKSVNRYFHIDTASGLTLVPSNREITLNWDARDIDVNADPAHFLISKYTSGSWLPTTPMGIGAVYQQASFNQDDITGDYQIGEPLGPPVIVMQPTSQTFCSGISASFSTSVLVASYYQWQVNTGSGWDFVSNNNIYSGVGTATLTLNNPPITFSGFQYRCVAYNDIDSTISAAASLTMIASVTPAVSISANPGNIVCDGTSILFTATPVNGGLSPTYQWIRNGLNVGSSNTYTLSAPAMGDVISCILTSSIACVTLPTAQAAPVTLTVNPTVNPMVSITAATGTTACAASVVTFSATTTNAGMAPVYQWMKNGLPVGTNSTTYSDNTLANGDTINCVVTVNSACPSTPTVVSNTLAMTILPIVTPSVSINTASNNVCSNDSVLFTATLVNGGLAPQLSWMKNGISTGVTTATYKSIGFATGDVITCQLTSNAACAATATATSSPIILTVTPSVVPSITITASPGTTVCSGSPVVFRTTTVNGGPLPQYQWKINGVVQTGAIVDTFTTATLSNGATVTCVLTSSAACATPLSVSNTIPITVTPSVTPTVSVSAGTGTICAGSTVRLTATANTGISTYQWTVNGQISGSNSANFSYIPANGDIVICNVTAASVPCLTSTTASSAPLTLTVRPRITPGITITGPANAATGSQVTLNAQLSNASPTYSIEWRKNRSLFATTITPTANYIKTPGPDTILAIIRPTGSAMCYDTVMSDTVVIRPPLSIYAVESLTDDIVVMPNPFTTTLRVEGMKEISKIQLLNGLGQVVQEWPVELNVSSVTLYHLNGGDAGIYYLRFTDRLGIVRRTMKLLKH